MALRLPEFQLPKKPIERPFLLYLFVFSLIFGMLGAFIGIGILSSNEAVRKLFGLDGSKSLTIPTTRTEKVVVEESSAVIDAAKKISPAVVSIAGSRDIRSIFGGVIEQPGGIGTGFLVTSDGLILTNKHVVDDGRAEYTVITADGKNFPAKVLSKDPLFDLAIVKIEARGLPVVELGDSEKVQVGQHVIAIGNALGQFQNTVTVGVLSATERSITASDVTGSRAERLEGLFQTDAAINPGNSGGPLINIKGQVIGINTAVAGGAQNIGFAIPINRATQALDSHRKLGRIARPLLGIRYLAVTKETQALSNLPVDHGAFLAPSDEGPSVLPGSPAAKAGLKEGDIILELQGERIDEQHSLSQLLQDHEVGEEIELTVLSGSTRKTVRLTLGEFK